ncbi:MAG: SLC13 family permease [Candidatus Heimdallarchaeaceae archaeon]
MTLLLLAKILISLIVVAVIIALMFEGVDKTKVTFVGALGAIFTLRYFVPWEELYKEAFNPEHEPHFTELLAHFVNFEAVIIIFSISIIVALVKKAGFFDWLSLSIVRLTRGNLILLFLGLGGVSFFVSMFFDNLSAIILLGSLTFIVCRQVDVDPKPYILFVGINTILGGLPTPVSSLPNIIFSSSYREISFLKFVALMLPLGLLLYAISAGYFYLKFRDVLSKEIPEEKKDQIARINPWAGIENKANIWKSIILLTFLFGGFLLANTLGLTVDIIALISVGFGLILFRTNLKHFIERDVEWETLIFFISLFVLMGVLNASGVLEPIMHILQVILDSTRDVTGKILIALIIGVVGFIISGFINVVPAAVIFSDIFAALSLTSLGVWFAFVVTGNVAGGLTPLGSVTILMTLEILKSEKQPVSFGEYIKQTIPLTIALQVISITYTILLIVTLG